MRYSKMLVPITLVAGAAIAASAACTTRFDDDGRTQQARANLPGDPPGNNGTVKIQEVGDEIEIPDNDPHVGCKFQIEFRGFDEGDLHAQWSLLAHPPSGDGKVVASNSVFIGEDAAGGAPDLDAIVVVNIADYDLSGLTEHPQQGYHLKLEVHAEGSKGADTKFKVFWVKGCSAAPDAGGGSSSSSSSSGGSSSSSGGTPTW